MFFRNLRKRTMSLSPKHNARNALHRTVYRNKVARFGGGSRHAYRRVMRRGRFA